jgi:hypothetical protein
MQERWDLLGPYPTQLRSYVQLFTTYTDAAFPSDLPSDYGLRVALRYEVGRFFAAVERLKRAVAKQALEEAYTGKNKKSVLLLCIWQVVWDQHQTEFLFLLLRFFNSPVISLC